MNLIHWLKDLTEREAKPVRVRLRNPDGIYYSVQEIATHRWLREMRDEVLPYEMETDDDGS